MKNFKRSSVALLTAIYLMVDVFGSLVLVSPAKASPVTDVGAVTQRQLLNLKEEGKFNLSKVLTMSAMAALVNAASYFTRKLSYDAAKFIASGGKGQDALIFKEGIGKYMENTALDSVSTAVDSLGKPFGLNLCQIPNPSLDISLKIGYRNLFPTGQEPKPKCSWQQLRNGWGNIEKTMTDRYGEGGTKFVSETFHANLSVSESDFGIALDTMTKLDELYASSRQVAQLDRVTNKGVKDVVGFISGDVETPGSLINKELDNLSPSEQAKRTEGQIAGMYGSSLEALPAMAASVFLNALISNLLQNVASGLFKSKPGLAGKASNGLASGVNSLYASALQGNKKAAERAFSFLTTPTITQVDDYKIVDQLFVDKAIDTGLQQAVNRGNNAATVMTIGEALESNYLHRDWPLIPPTHAWNSSEERDCYVKGYCYSNLQKLRKARILPVGFELAALESDPDEPWTLGKVVDGFNDCTDGKADTNHPYCHLIDPNWILKAPEARCKTEAIGPELAQPGINNRKTECMDLETCISKNDDGTCNYWGYCTKEENMWRLGGESCPDYYNTCTTFKNTSTQQASSYLSRTLDFGQCDIKSVGCQAYSGEQIKDTATGEWKWVTALIVNGSYKGFGRNQMAYFNRNADTCSASAEGCKLFYGAQRASNTNTVDPNDVLPNIFNKTSSGGYTRDSANNIYLKKAPDYLKCYDTNTAGNSLAIDWPKSKTEVLTKIAANDSRCNDFAQVCAPEEVGCNRFNPTAGGNGVTAILDVNNVCAKECVGYESFKQEESNFESEKFPLYFVPTLGQSCSASVAGCSEFTNLSSTGGGESLVYYSYTRLCEKPDKIDEKTFFSWEGSESEGYVLRNHLLKTLNDDGRDLIYNFDLGYIPGDSVDDSFPAGSPAYGNTTKKVIQRDYTYCNANSYKLLITDPFAAGAANTDCRQLYDDAGHIYYRILKDTVVIDNACQRLRKSETNLFEESIIAIADSTSCTNQSGYWDGTACQLCYGGGKYVGDSCIYEALPSQSDSCQSTENGCRAYTGNAGNNVKPGIVVNTFEGDPSTAQDGWSSGSQATESLQTGQHSLKVGVITVDREIPAGILVKNGWYEMSFVARGAPRNLTISFVQDGVLQGSFTLDPRDLVSTRPITIGNEWQEYHLGPVQFTGSNSNSVLVRFDTYTPPAATGDYFVDNFNLSQVEGSVFLVKNSWKQTFEFNGEQVTADAPQSCYMGLDPRTPWPGAALGCREYKDENSNIYYITGFSALCREAAVGCQPLFESNNTSDEVRAVVYNLICEGTAGSNCTLNILGETGSCYIEQGQTGCYVPKMVLPINSTTGEYTLLSDLDFNNTNIGMDISTVYIPPEDARPVYLTNVSQYQCGAGQRGCTLLGLQDQTIPTTDESSYKYSDVYVLNNPDTYGATLCRQDLIGCNEYSAGANTYYFKDPVEEGNYLCVYKDNVDGFNGWFKDGVGSCKLDETVLCKSDSDCGTGDTCTNLGSVPCYPGYLQNENYYNIWSNKSADYSGFVGVCEPRFNGCTEFLDPADTSSLSPDGRPYYRIFDERLTGNVAECNGQVSLKEGCVLFDKTDQPNKLYNTELTYRASDETNPKYSPVNPVSSSVASTPNDANIILKVDRDRECSEWLACKNMTVRFNDKGQKETVCSKYQACDKIRGGKQNTREGCGHFVDVSWSDAFLNEEKYLSRDLSWFGFDYSGYSILQKYQISTYEYISFGGNDEYLGVSIGSTIDNTCVPSGSEDTIGNSCGVGDQGRCFGGKCIYTIDSSSFESVSGGDTKEQKIEKMRKALLSASCKAYPEDTSPFPQSVAVLPVEEYAPGKEGQASVIKKNTTNVPGKSRTEFLIANSNFSGVNICQNDVKNCSCNYNKFIYGASGIVDYYDPTISTTNIPKGVCVGGDHGGEPCSLDTHCGTGSTCNKLKQIDTKLGLLGFCLEPDLSRPINGLAKGSNPQEYACQTWLPIQTSASSVDLNNMNLSAGYIPDANNDTAGTIGGEMYCANSLQGGIVDKTIMSDISLAQTRVNAGHYSNNVVSSLFGYKYFSTNCELNVNSDCGTNNICVIDHTEIGGLLDQSANIVKQIGETVGGVTAIPPTSFDYFSIGSVFFHLICNQYNYLKTSMVPRLMSQDVYDNYSNNLQSDVYKSLQAWAWNKIGPNSVVIRAEYDVEPSGNNGFAPINSEYVNNFSAGVTSDKVGGLNGRFVFENTDQFINENNIKNVYFVPLNFKGTMRGLVPKQINNLSSVNPFNDTNSYLKLPIEDLKNNLMANGQIKAFTSMYIQHTGRLPSGGSYDASTFWPETIINWTGDIDSDFVTHMNSSGQVNLGNAGYISKVGERLYDPSIEADPGTDPFLVWRYKHTVGTKTKYVLSWFADDTFPMAYGGDKYDTGAPSFMGNILSSGKSSDSDRPVVLPGDPGVGDPFTTDCYSGYYYRGGSVPATYGTEDERHNAWWAVSANFDNSGKFEGFTTKWCDGLGTVAAADLYDSSQNSHWSLGRGGINYAVIVELENQCTDFIKVQKTDAGLVETKNKAWTNRVWGNAKNKATKPLPHPFLDYGYLYSDGQGLVNINTTHKGFGSLNLDASEDFTLLSGKDKLLKYYLQDPATDGIPYACAETLSAGTNTNSVDIGSIKPCGFPLDSQTKYWSDGSTSNYLQFVLHNTSGYKTIGHANSAINNLFAWFVNRYKVNTANLLALESSVAGADYSATLYGKQIAGNASYEYNEYLLPPRVFSLNPFTCGAGGNCAAGDADNITVNNINGTKKDYNADTIADSSESDQLKDHIGFGSFEADIKFFAYADDNRMPIRKVTVNWSDGHSNSQNDVTNLTRQGFYKNSKPFCSSLKNGEVMPLCQMVETSLTPNVKMPSNLTCRDTGENNIDKGKSKDCPIELGAAQKCLTSIELNTGNFEGMDPKDAYSYGAPRFGSTPRACSTEPFEFVHTYNCTDDGQKVTVADAELSPSTKTRLLAMEGVKNDTEICIYKPKIQLIDNWGYCNGRCVGGAGGDYCYSGGDAALLNNGQPALGKGECVWPDFNATGYAPNPNNMPYTEYKGNIIVITETAVTP